jgi:hypothetical protein
VHRWARDLFRDGGQALGAGLVRAVDQLAQRISDLAWPDGIRVGFGGVGQITQQVRVMPISA